MELKFKNLFVYCNINVNHHFEPIAMHIAILALTTSCCSSIQLLRPTPSDHGEPPSRCVRPRPQVQKVAEVKPVISSAHIPANMQCWCNKCVTAPANPNARPVLAKRIFRLWFAELVNGASPCHIQTEICNYLSPLPLLQARGCCRPVVSRGNFGVDVILLTAMKV